MKLSAKRRRNRRQPFVLDDQIRVLYRRHAAGTKVYQHRLAPRYMGADDGLRFPSMACLYFTRESFNTFLTR